MERQTRQEYIHDLEVVQDLVATMGDKALDNVEKSMKALLEGVVLFVCHAENVFLRCRIKFQRNCSVCYNADVVINQRTDGAF